MYHMYRNLIGASTRLSRTSLSGQKRARLPAVWAAPPDTKTTPRSAPGTIHLRSRLVDVACATIHHGAFQHGDDLAGPVGLCHLHKSETFRVPRRIPIRQQVTLSTTPYDSKRIEPSVAL